MEEFSNEAVDLEKLPKYEELNVEPINRKYWWVILFNLIITFGSFAGFTVLARKDIQAHIKTPMLLSFIGFAFLVFVVLYWFSLKRRAFAIREKDIVYRSGLLEVNTTIIPFNRMQHIAIREGFISRPLGLASIKMYTAGGANSDVTLVGLNKDHAQQLQEFIMEKIKEVHG